MLAWKRRAFAYFLLKQKEGDSVNQWQKLDKRWLIGVCSVVVILMSGLLIKRIGFSSHSDFLVDTQTSTSLDKVDVASPVTTEPAELMTTSSEVIAYADIKGAVKAPGIYQVTPNMRVSEVITLAGGMTAKADADQVNLAQVVTDQMVIYVPKIGEILPEVAQNQLASTEVGNVEASPSSGASSNNSEKVNINTADLAGFQSLNGVGAVKAQAMIDYREANGAFQSIEELKNVKGVGEKTFDSLKESITID